MALKRHFSDQDETLQVSYHLSLDRLHACVYMRVCVSRVAAMLHDLYGGRTLFCMKTPTKLLVFVCVVCCLLWLLSIRRNRVCCASETGFLGDDSFTAAACLCNVCPVLSCCCYVLRFSRAALPKLL